MFKRKNRPLESFLFGEGDSKKKPLFLSSVSKKETSDRVVKRSSLKNENNEDFFQSMDVEGIMVHNRKLKLKRATDKLDSYVKSGGIIKSHSRIDSSDSN